ncbi:zinc finger bed domain-containing protein daysleeper [Quercus suber]|uniref:Zinc finger bed domain-containing protein daysleeper n=1 Tax=Quercus suber TaxID=58331 RepID=A0AAW0JEM7_QUESU
MATTDEGKIATPDEHKMETSDEHTKSTPDEHKMETSDEHTKATPDEQTMTTPDEHTLTTPNEQTLTTQNDHTISNEHTVEMSNEHTVTISNEHTMANPDEHAMIISNDHTMPAPDEHALVISNDHTMANPDEHALVISNDHTMATPDEHALVISNEHTMETDYEHTMATPDENKMITTTPEVNNELPNSETQPNKRRKKKSIVWEHFTIENVSAGCRRACCKQCKQSFAYSTGSKVAGTSHLKRHIAKGTCPALLRNQGQNQQSPYTPRSRSLSEAALETLRPLLAIKNPLILNGQLLVGNCVARTFSSVAKDVLGSGEEIIKKIRDSVKYVKTSESHEEKFFELKRQLQVPSERSLCLDDQSQWNTTYQMLVAASELKEVFSCLDTSDPDYKEAPSMEDWKQDSVSNLILCTFIFGCCVGVHSP